MKVRDLITLALCMSMASCIASPGLSPSTTGNRIITQESTSPTVPPIGTVSQTETSTASEPTQIPPIPATPSTGSFELIGHTPLLSRGMNAAPAVHGNYAYVGSRTDGSHADAGVLVVD